MVLILVSVLSLINADDIDNGLRRIKKLASFILLVPIFIAMVSVRTNLVKPFLIGACIGGFVLPGITIYQGYFLGYTRITGFYNWAMFGSVAVIMALALFCGLLFIKSKGIYRSLIYLSLLGALFAAIQSGTRGAWIGLIAGVPLALCLSFVIGGIPKKRIMLVLLSGILVASIAGILGEDKIISRWNATNQAIDLYLTGSNNNTNINDRFLMWDAAIKIWLRHPVIGSGIGDFHKDYEKMLESGEAGIPGVNITPWSYAHSNYFDALAGTGILGLVCLITSTFILPITFFLKALKSSINGQDRYAVVFGLVFVTAFMIFGLTENWLAHSQLVMAFSLLLAILASRFGARVG